MNNKLLFSIVVPFYNESRKLPTLIASLRNQEFDKDRYEIVLVDNMSTDDSHSVAREALATFRQAKVVYCDDFRSSYAARNVGWNVAEGDYVIFIDADCIADKFLLTNYYKYVNSFSSGDVGVYAGSILPHSRDDQSNIERYSADRKFLNQDSAVKGWAFRPFAQTANAMFPKPVLAAVGGFNGRMTSGGDGEICWRIFDRLGKRVEYAKEAVVFHWHREDISDLFAQFEKYGVGKFQQSGIVADFDQGLKGVTKGTLIDLMQNLEKNIFSLNESSAKDKLLWSLYDVVARVSNVYGYLSAKSQLSDRRTPEGKADPFAAPTFRYFCSKCGAPNADLSPTFARRVNESLSSDDCQSCGATLAVRLCEDLQKKNLAKREYKGVPTKIEFFTDELVRSGAVNNESLYILAEPTSIGTVLFAIRAVKAKRSSLIVIKTATTDERITVNRPSYMNGTFDSSGIFQDSYTGTLYWYCVVEAN